MLPFGIRNGIGEIISSQDAQILGTSGTVTTLAALHLGLSRYDRAKVDGAQMTVGQIAAVTENLGNMSKSERARHPCIGTGRADLVLAGCAILEAMSKTWDFKQLRVADRGVREGVLLDMMSKVPNRQAPA